MSERERIQRRIFALRKSIDVYLAFGDSAEVSRLLDTISGLERQLDQINQRERKAREKSGQQCQSN